MGSTGSRQSAVPAWRTENPIYQEQTAGGVYFYSAPAGWGMDIDRTFYKALPNYAKKAVLSLDVSRTADGTHYSMNYVNNSGVVEYMDEYGREDFMWLVRRAKNDMGDMNNWIDDWRREGDQLRRK